jgi:hypothetical protein
MFGFVHGRVGLARRFSVPGTAFTNNRAGVGLARRFSVPGTAFTNNRAGVGLARRFSGPGTGFRLTFDWHSRTVELIFMRKTVPYH